MKRFLRTVGYFWASPTTLLGLGFLVPMWGLRQIEPLRWREGVWEWRIVPGSRFWRRYSMRGGWSATTLGFCVFYTPGSEDDGRVAVHERRHVWQVMCLGPFFFPAYGVLHLICGYERNPLEIDARAHEADAV